MGPTKGARSLSQFSHNQDRLPGVPDQPDFPPDFDPDLCPILARHWFGIFPHGLASIWWRFAGLGHRLPAERGIILIHGGK